MEKNTVLQLLSKQTLMSLATYGKNYPDNSVVCFSYDDNCNLYFGSYSDTLKCKNISNNKVVAVTVGTLQIHGEAGIVEYGTDEYRAGRAIYDKRFPQYREIFEREKNELYIIKPYVIWNYNPAEKEMYRDTMVIHEKYYNDIEVYHPHSYGNR